MGAKEDFGIKEKENWKVAKRRRFVSLKLKLIWVQFAFVFRLYVDSIDFNNNFISECHLISAPSFSFILIHVQRQKKKLFNNNRCKGCSFVDKEALGRLLNATSC